jgi:peptidoglycan/xylan/chitin deacetylase (PgdA/CDA1 family)
MKRSQCKTEIYSSTKNVKLFWFSIRLNWLLSHLVNRPVILGFHRIKKSSGGLMDRRIGVTNPKIFRKIINYMKCLGYTFTTLESLAGVLKEGKMRRFAVITFDDGFKDLYENAYPILKRNKIPFTLFLITSTVDSKKLLWLHKFYMSIEGLPPNEQIGLLKESVCSFEKNVALDSLVRKAIHSSDRRTLREIVHRIASEGGLTCRHETVAASTLYLKKSELLEMEKDGLSIESHGHEHWSFDKLQESDVKKDIELSVRFIQEEFGKRTRFVSLPFGRENGCVEGIAECLGLSGVCYADQKLLGPSTNPFKLSRILPPNDILEFSQILMWCYLGVLRDGMGLKIGLGSKIQSG